MIPATKPSAYPFPVWPLKTVREKFDLTGYLATPAILKLAEDDYLIGMDSYGPAVPNTPNSPSFTNRTVNAGASFTAGGGITGMFWGSLFKATPSGLPHYLGVGGEIGPNDIVIARSADNGATWTKATLLAGRWASSATKTVIKNGRIYKVMERMNTSHRPDGFMVMHADVTSDLLLPGSWTYSAVWPFSAPMGGAEWLEGHAVELPQDEGTPYVSLLFRIMFGGNNIGKARFHTGTGAISLDASPNPYHECQFGWCKFAFQKCPFTGYYIVAGNWRDIADGSENRRNPSLIVTRDFTPGSYRRIYKYAELTDPIARVGVQYPDIVLDGMRLITVWRDATDGSADYHNARKITWDKKDNYLPILHNL